VAGARRPVIDLAVAPPRRRITQNDTMIRLFTFLIALAIPAVSLAQSFPEREIDTVSTEARGRLGPFYIKPNVIVKELGVDNNVFNAAGEQQSDFTFTITPKSDIWLPVARRGLFKAIVASDFVWYAEYDSERSIDPQVTARAEVYLNRITLYAEDAYLNTRQRPNHEIDVRSRHVENNFISGAQVAVTPEVSIEVAGRRFETRYDSDAMFDGTSLQSTLKSHA
jgi:hypothetical protein